MAKNDNTILLIAGIILVLLLINYYQKPEDFSIEPRYYKNGVEINLAPGFAIVRGTYDEISFNIYGTETEGGYVSDLHITDASPTAFANSLPTTYQSLNPYESKLLWVSDRIDVNQFIALPQPVEFQVEVTSGETSKITSTFLEIFEELMPLRISDLEGASTTIYCGDDHDNYPNIFNVDLGVPTYPFDEISFGFLMLYYCPSIFNDRNIYSNNRVGIEIEANDLQKINAGDTITLIYDGGQQKIIYLPEIQGAGDYILYVVQDGSTYWDEELTQLAYTHI